MFSKVIVILVATMTALVSAGGIEKSCNTGPIQCCEWSFGRSMYRIDADSMSHQGNSVHKYSDADAGLIKQLIGITIPVGIDVFSNCSPITGVGIGGGAGCSSQPVCCEDNHFGELCLQRVFSISDPSSLDGLVAVGCSPIGVNA